MSRSSVTTPEQRAGRDGVLDHLPLVTTIARQVFQRCPRNVELSDLVQAGVEGLLQCADRFDRARTTSFAAYASPRVRGAMLDEVRRTLWGPRSLYRRARLLESAVARAELAKGAAATPAEVAASADITLAEYFATVRDLRATHLTSFDEFEFDGGDDNCPLAHVGAASLGAALQCALNSLTARERDVLHRYYDQEQSLKAIGAALGVSESRVSQIRTEATVRLRRLLDADLH